MKDAAIATSGFIAPDWSAPACVRAYVTTRLAPGVSRPPFDRCNLGDHVGDDASAVQRNRGLLSAALNLPTEPLWLRQVHGTQVCDADRLIAAADRSAIVADAALTRRPAQVLAVMTADCLPLLLCADDGSEVAALHAGWRGLAAGIIETTVARMHTPPKRLLVWLGPAIGPRAFEVGADVRDIFVHENAAAKAAFSRIASAGSAAKCLCDLYQLARLRLDRLAVAEVSGGGYCTFSDPEHFFSHRRDRSSGRMASLIWIEPAL